MAAAFGQDGRVGHANLSLLGEYRGRLTFTSTVILPVAKRWGGGPSAGWWRGRDVALSPLRQRFALPPPHRCATGRSFIKSTARSSPSRRDRKSTRLNSSH